MKVVRLVRLDNTLLAYVPRSQCYRMPHAQPVFPDSGIVLSHATCPASVPRYQSYHKSQGQPMFTDLTVLSHATCPACVPRSSQYYLSHALEQTISLPLTYKCELAQPTASMFWISFLIFLFLNLWIYVPQSLLWSFSSSKYLLL